MKEVVRAFNWVIQKTMVKRASSDSYHWMTNGFHLGISLGNFEWTAREIEEAWHIADSLGLRGPISERCEHHMFHRERPEKEYEKYNMSTMTFSPLVNGVLYNNGIQLALVSTRIEELL
ncbi:hypothetical protein AGABI2DRAFT_113689 [Agaricus bisporus var. bisporus H97]|uniref:hypothetical protein n=1 Tax=Agaricus bisporus var. bisporus (strain H97 / ATCC MYA-4626 / FGSC 10389) TaxID=936046 RepID=UPI00029F78F6|nr:hypothetical protein AGABI2DRAFT_113689 [Agaricus bisporus var. bisporus H97]EKV50946.1 hypothetical protein AGABI2DRAFT_113689 [Agaricus bisporus var. bisporus H97]